MLKSHKLITLILFFIFLNPLLGQRLSKKQIDSTYTTLKVKPNTTDKVDKLISLYNKAVRAKVPGENIIDDAISISEELFYIKGLGVSYDSVLS